jgi:hypothetical protein
MPFGVNPTLACAYDFSIRRAMINLSGKNRKAQAISGRAPRPMEGQAYSIVAKLTERYGTVDICKKRDGSYTLSRESGAPTFDEGREACLEVSS